MPCKMCGLTGVAMAICYFCDNIICIENCLMWKKDNDGNYHHCCASCKGIENVVKIPIAIPIKFFDLQEEIHKTVK